MSKVELLAPAGNYDCFLAAVHAGADAVYLGGEKFGARAYAGNFSIDEIIKALDYAHILNKKIYLTVNTVTKNKELDELLEYIKPLYIAGLDGVIVQDIGVVKLLKNVFPQLPIHASTQMAITDAEAVELLSGFGIERVVPARELSLAEIKNIKDKTGMEIECFIHGAMCYSYSGKCLFSSFLGDRSGNRGRCAGTCRLAYNNEYILSMKDMCTVDLLPDLIKSGIDSFKIEGRMKSKEYVAGVTGIYRKYIDLFYSGNSYKVDEDDKNDLINIYTRGGNCQGYYNQYNGREMLTINKAGYDTANNDKALDIYSKYNDFSPRMISTYISISSEGTYMSIFDENNSVSVSGAIPQKSLSRPLTYETVYKQINKTGDTPFQFENIDINIEDDLFLPMSDLNSLRRDAINSFCMELLAKYRRNEVDIVNKYFSNNIYEKTSNRLIDYSNFGNYHCMVYNYEQIEPLLKYDCVDIISVMIDAFYEKDQNPFELIQNTYKLIHNYGKQFYLCLPYVIRKGFFDKNCDLTKIITNYTDGIVVDNYESIKYLVDINYKGEIIGDIHLYALNMHAVDAYCSMGVNILTLPVELNKKELRHVTPYNYEIIKYGRIPLVVSAQCLNKTLNGCNHKCSKGNITDRKNKDFIYMNRCMSCTNILFNSVPTYLSNNDISSLELSNIRCRIIFTDEDKSAVDKILRSIIDDEITCEYTKGHFNRGVE